jgi:hypothetical protein
LELLHVSLRTGQSGSARIDRLPLRHAVTELAFDCDSKGRFHLLAATSAEKLYYLGPNLGPHLVAAGQYRFFPHVIVRKGVYLGYYNLVEGFRFNLFIRGKGGPKIVSFEEPE